MKYKIGDKVKIKRDKEFNSEALYVLRKNNYILTIESVNLDYTRNDGFYRVEEFEYMTWKEEYMEGLYKEPIITDPTDLISDRFEILDL